MKKIIFTLIILGVMSCKPVFAEELIKNFQADINLKNDGTIQVVETIDYDFGNQEKHGIYRDLPFSYQNTQGIYKLRLSNIAVTRQDERIKFTQSQDAGMIRLKIGDENKTISGQNRFIISYDVGRAINFFNDQDELYWNVTGNGWLVPIDSIRASVNLPARIDLAQMKTACYAGAAGSRTSCSNILFPDLAAEQAGSRISQIEFRQIAAEAGEGLTIVVGLPKGIINQPTVISAAKELLLDNYYGLLPILFFAAMFYLWYTRGRDPAGRGVIISQFEAPDNLSPAEVGTIIDEQADSLDISAEIIHLAVLGYLKINQVKEPGLIMDKEDYHLQKLKDQADLENDFDRYLMTAIFKGKNETKISELKKTLYKDLSRIKTMIYQATANKGYFIANPERVRKSFLVVSGLILLIVVYFYNSIGFLNTAGLAISALIVALFGWQMPARTAKGVTAREHILGFKGYLQVAEKDRLAFANAPAKNPAIFEKYLPYAMVLKVEKEWAGQFAGIYDNNNPAWYSSYNHSMFNALVLTESLHDFSAKTNAVLGASAAGHSSGFGGGGSSGGGFGGGGGGSW